MKVLVTGDWHIGVSQYGVALEDGRNSRLVDVEAVLHRVIDFAAKQSVDLFVCAGDVFHTNRPTPEEQRVFYRILLHLQRVNLESRFIIGNHDYNAKLGASHAMKIFMDVLEGDESIKIYDETTWESFEQPDGDPLLVCFYPYRGTAPEWAEMAQYGAVHATALVCHSHLEGAVVGAEPFEIRDDTATRFSQLPVDFVWAGHFHKPQLLCHRPLAFYPGSIQCVDFNERHDVKGVVLVDTRERTYECAGFETRRFVQADLDGRVELSDADMRDMPEAIVKVNIKMPESRAHEFNEAAIRQQIVDRGAHSVAAINLELERQVVVRDAEVRLDRGLKENFTRFAEGRDYGDIATEVMAKGLEVIERCAQ